MGSSQSQPKKVTFERNGDGAIEVTQDAFDLMTGKKPSAQSSSSSSSATGSDENNKENAQGPTSSHQKRQQLYLASDINHAKLMEIEERFQERIRKLEATQRRDLEAEKAELEAAVNELESKLSHSVVAIDGVCRASQDAVVACYRANPKKSLNCAKVIEQFSQCVNNERLRLLGVNSSSQSSSGSASAASS